MTDPGRQSTIEMGRELVIVAKTHRGHVPIPCTVVYVSAHHFRVRTQAPLPARTLIPGQEVKIRPAEVDSSVALACKYLRGNEVDTDVIVLSVPDGEWRQNRRAFVRAAVELPVVVTRCDGSTAEGRTLDLSGGGALLHVEGGALLVGEEVQLDMRLPQEQGGAQIRLLAKVVRDDPRAGATYGVHFTNARTRDQNLVCKIVVVKQFEDRRAELRELTERSESR